jgi:hypothetical protein
LPAGAPRQWSLHLLAQFSAMDYRPYQGSATLRVRIRRLGQELKEAEDLCSPIVVSQPDCFAFSTTLNSLLLPPDDQPSTLSIELDPDSPSQCWLRFAAVSVP